MKNRILLLLRRFGLYRGPIRYVLRAETAHLGIAPREV